VLDLACGLNPLALPWMRLAPGATYYACDIYSDMIDFVGAMLALAGVERRAFVHDLAAGAPPVRADLALALKLLPTIEQIERGAGLRLLQSIDAPHIVVSFPARSLGGRNKGMAANYERDFRALVDAQGWEATLLPFEQELVFLLSKQEEGS
jgi:16S rRNA (guanine(1405)-N(7))-methyltransferase